MTNDEKREEVAYRLQRGLEASLEPAIDEILGAERTETTTYKQECQRVLKLEELAWDDFQKTLEPLIDAALERGETCLIVEINPAGVSLNTKE